MTLNIMEHEYTKAFGGPAGARVIVHPYKSMPFPEEQGILVQPGVLSSLRVKKVIISVVSLQNISL